MEFHPVVLTLLQGGKAASEKAAPDNVYPFRAVETTSMKAIVSDEKKTPTLDEKVLTSLLEEFGAAFSERKSFCWLNRLMRCHLAQQYEFAN